MKFRKLLVGMERVAVGAQGAYGDALVLELLLELLDLGGLPEQIKLQVRVTGIITGPQLNRADAERLDLLDDLIQAKLGQQSCKESDFHRVSPHGRRVGPARRWYTAGSGPCGCLLILEFHLKRR